MLGELVFVEEFVAANTLEGLVGANLRLAAEHVQLHRDLIRGKIRIVSLGGAGNKHSLFLI